MTAKNLYAYTLQPVNYEISEAEQRQAQLTIWRSTNKINTKTWIIMAAVAVLSIVGIFLLKNYSTIFCWVALFAVVAYFLVRKFGTNEISGLAAKLITLAKQGDLHSRRQVLAFLVDEEATKKLFDEIAPKYTDRNGGYTRIYKLGPRRGDAAEMAILELV